jgi:hypothetical protein
VVNKGEKIELVVVGDKGNEGGRMIRRIEKKL